jgi:hypothetical protein
VIVRFGDPDTRHRDIDHREIRDPEDEGTGTSQVLKPQRHQDHPFEKDAWQQSTPLGKSLKGEDSIGSSGVGKSGVL